MASPAPGQPWMVAARAWADGILMAAKPSIRLPAGPLTTSPCFWPVALAIGQLVALVGASAYAWRRGAREATLCQMGALASVVGLLY